MLTSPYHYIDAEVLIHHFHIRCLRVIPPDYDWSDKTKTDGIKLSRAFWEEKTAFLNPQKRFRLREVRMSAALRVQAGKSRPYFTTIKLMDGMDDAADVDLPPKGGVPLTRGPAGPIASFQNTVLYMLEEWACCWRGVLDEIDQIVSVRVRVWLDSLLQPSQLPRARELTRRLWCRAGRGSVDKGLG